MRVWSYLTIMMGVVLLFAFVGVDSPGEGSSGVNTTTSDALNSIGLKINASNSKVESFDLKNSKFYLDVFKDNVGITAGGLLAGLLIGGAIIVGLYRGQFEWKIVVISFILWIVASFIGVGANIIQYAIATGEDWLIAVICTIYGTILVGFLWSFIDWFAGGND